MSDRDPVCFTCGNSSAKESLGNRMADGRPCKTCFERILDAQPPLLPNFGFDYDFEHLPEVELDEELTVSVEFEDDDDGPIGA